MNVSEVFLRATIPPDITCLGVRLRPFSLGHYVHMRAIENCFVCGGFPSAFDLATGVLICSQTFEDGIKAIRSRMLVPLLKFWAWRTRKLNPVDQIQTFRLYLENGLLMADKNVIEDKDERRQLSSPWEHRLKIILMQELGLSESEVMNRPLALSQIDYDVISEMNGGTEFFSERDAELFRVAKSL